MNVDRAKAVTKEFAGETFYFRRGLRAGARVAPAFWEDRDSVHYIRARTSEPEPGDF
jgi:hypothetical protein